MSRKVRGIIETPSRRTETPLSTEGVMHAMPGLLQSMGQYSMAVKCNAIMSITTFISRWCQRLSPAYCGGHAGDRTN